MNIKINTDEKNPLFKRREIKAHLGYDAKTPSRLDIRKELAKKLGAKEELVVVKKINPDYGTPAAELEINLYDDEKTMREVEEEYMVNRHSAEKKEKKEAEAAPAEGIGKAPEKAPAAEKKEEAKPEEKKEEKSLSGA